MEATKGALWDAYAEVAIYMEILYVQVGAARRGLFHGEHHLPARCWRVALSAAGHSLRLLGYINPKIAEQVPASVVTPQEQ